MNSLVMPELSTLAVPWRIMKHPPSCGGVSNAVSIPQFVPWHIVGGQSMGSLAKCYWLWHSHSHADTKFLVTGAGKTSCITSWWWYKNDYHVDINCLFCTSHDKNREHLDIITWFLPFQLWGDPEDITVCMEDCGNRRWAGLRGQGELWWRE